MRKFNDFDEVETEYVRLRKTGKEYYKYIIVAATLIRADIMSKTGKQHSLDDIMNIDSSVYEVLILWAETSRLTELMDDLNRKRQLEAEKYLIPEYMDFYRMYHRESMLRKIKSNLKNK